MTRIAPGDFVFLFNLSTMARGSNGAKARSSGRLNFVLNRNGRMNPILRELQYTGTSLLSIAKLLLRNRRFWRHTSARESPFSLGSREAVGWDQQVDRP